MPCDRIARDLALRGVKTYTGRPCGYTMVYRMLHNEKYRGMYSWGGVTRADGMPRIVDDGLFFAVQGVRGRKARADESWGDFMLSGKVICAECGRNMPGVSGRGRGGTKYEYHACKGCKSVRPVRRDWLEGEIAAAIRDALSDPGEALRIAEMALGGEEDASARRKAASRPDGNARRKSLRKSWQTRRLPPHFEARRSYHGKGREIRTRRIRVRRKPATRSHRERRACHPLGQLRFGWDIAGAYIDGHGKYHSGDHYEINQREAEAVRTMYRLRARGFAWTAIARTLNEKGYKNKYGRPITDVMVAVIVRNEAYKGVYAFGHVRVEGGLPRIVADAEWDAAQDKRRRMSVKHRRHVYVRPGMQFGHLQVVESAGTAKHHTKWLCECKACGSTKVEWATRLTSGKAQDCGCLSGDGRNRDDLGRFE